MGNNIGKVLNQEKPIVEENRIERVDADNRIDRLAADNKDLLKTYILLKECFKCAICGNHLFPPIPECYGSHLFCSVCFNSLNNCPICNLKKLDVRSPKNETLARIMIFPCRYRYKGCKFFTTGKKMAEHETTCEFSCMNCPLQNNGCEWYGKRSQLLEHLTNLHPTNVFTTHFQCLRILNFTKTDKTYYIMFYLYNNFFRCTFELKGDSGIIKIGVTYIEPVLQRTRYSFQVCFCEGKFKRLNQIGKATWSIDDNIKFAESGYVTYEYDDVKKYCDSSENIVFCVKIVLESGHQ